MRYTNTGVSRSKISEGWGSAPAVRFVLRNYAVRSEKAKRFVLRIIRKGNLNYMGQKINFYGVVVSIWTNGFFRKMDNKGEEEVENYVCFLS